jgi:NhaP-type Na+/H+ or K+/H+ antiporter
VIWLKVVGIVLVVLAFDIAVGAGALIAVSLLSTARRLILWIGVGSLGFGLLSAAAGVLFVSKAYKWHGNSPWRSLPKG